ncbi:MAG: GFA family protein [Alphaproteobacteria bacterium]|nr:GFA family protein [Alphaproteobacteria bacterium]
MAEEIEGGCLCGAVRYKASGLSGAGYCHCRMCQKASGAPVVAWSAAPIGSFAWTKGKPKEYRSSAKASRVFCAQCGAQLGFMLSKDATEMELNLASLDHPEQVAPKYHIYTSTQMPWLHIEDDLPRYAEDRPK